jgi:hypothetical protein
MSRHLVTLIGVVDSLSMIIREFGSDLHGKDDILHRLGTLKKELLDAQLREISVTMHAERVIQGAIAGIHSAFSKDQHIQKFLGGLQHTLMAEVLPPPLPSCSVSQKSVQ